MRKKALLCAIAMTAFAAPVVIVSTVSAAAYPGTKCVSDKLKAASGNCKAVFGAWAKFAGGGGLDTVKRDESLAKAAGKMTASWGKAETKAADKGADCVDTTLTDAATQALITNAVAAVYADVTSGLTLSNNDDAKCGSALIKAAGAKCAAVLKAQAGYVGKLSAGKAKRDAGIVEDHVPKRVAPRAMAARSVAALTRARPFAARRLRAEAPARPSSGTAGA